MILANRSQLPSLPPVPSGKGPLQVDIDFVGPQTLDTRLGRVPKDSYTYTGREGKTYVSYSSGAPDLPKGREVVRPQPVYAADGQPVMANQTKHIRAQADSPISHGIVGGLIGGAAGLFLGAWPAILTGSGSVWGGCIAAGAAIGAGVGALGVANDRVRLEWREQPVLQHRLRGYTEKVEEDTHKDTDSHGHTSQHVDGYNHRIIPDIGSKQVGSYFEPMVVHFNKRTGEVTRVEGEHKPNE